MKDFRSGKSTHILLDCFSEKKKLLSEDPREQAEGSKGEQLSRLTRSVEANFAQAEQH